jgi:ubiquitin carboxyl-terminal hydrolase 8
MDNMDNISDKDKIKIISTSVFGLYNQENVCYLNAILQCLLSTNILNKSIIHADNYYPNTNNIFPQYRLILDSILNNNERLNINEEENNGNSISFNPISFRESFFSNDQMILGMQQDSHEFLIKFFDNMHETLKKNFSKKYMKYMMNISKDSSIKHYIETFNKNSSIVTEVLTTQKCSRRQCKKCGYNSNTFEYHNCIPLNLPYNQKTSTINESFNNNYMVPELLEGYKCDNCNGVDVVETMTKITMMPKILIILLKRFIIDNQGNPCKNNILIEFPINGFRIDPYMHPRDYDNSQKLYGTSNNCSYNLYGIVNHMGSLDGGHYNAFCKKEEKWYGFNDEQVYYIDTEKNDLTKLLVNNNAYILFYKMD